MRLALNIIQDIAIFENNIRDKFSKLPDNPKIKRLNHNCFEVKFSDLGDCWAPQYHDFKLQYTELIRLIDRTPIVNFDKVFGRVIKNRQIRETRKEGGYNITRLNLVVVEYLKDLIK